MFDNNKNLVVDLGYVEIEEMTLNSKQIVLYQKNVYNEIDNKKNLRGAQWFIRYFVTN